VAGVALGYLVFAVAAVAIFLLTGHDAHGPAGLGFKVGSILYGMAFAAIGGYVATRIARASTAAVTVGIVIAALAVLSVVLEGKGFGWSQLAAVVLMAPSAAWAGRLARVPARAGLR
jgi:drug/metabolite transporter (DMT)-like permease